MKYAKKQKNFKIKLDFLKKEKLTFSIKALPQMLSRYFQLLVENIKSGNIKKNRKKIVKFFAMLLILMLSINIFSNRYYLTPDQIITFFQDKFVSIGHGDGFPRPVYGAKVTPQNFQLLDGDVVLSSDTNITCYNKNSKEIFNRQHSFFSPTLKTTKNKALLYDLYGKSFYIDANSKNLYKSTLDDEILCAGIAENGNYGIATKTNGYFSKVSIFKRLSADKIYEYNFSDTYVSDLDLSPNGKNFSAVGLSSQNGCMYSNLFIFSCDDENPKFKIQFKDSMIFKLSYVNNNHIAVLGDNIFSVINTKNGQRKDYNFENKTLTAFEINKNDRHVLSLSNSDDGNSCEVILIDKNGDVLNNFKTDIKIKSISYKNRKIAALSYDKVYVYNKKGKLLKTLNCDQNTKVIKFFGGKKLYSLGISTVQKISF